MDSVFLPFPAWTLVNTVSAAAPRSRAPGGACIPEWAAPRVSAQGLPASPLLTCNWQNKSQATSDLQGQESSDPCVRKEARGSTLTCPPPLLFETGHLQGGGRGWVLCSELSAPLEVSVGSYLWSTEGISLSSSLQGRGALAQCSAPLHRGQSRTAGGLRKWGLVNTDLAPRCLACPASGFQRVSLSRHGPQEGSSCRTGLPESNGDPKITDMVGSAQQRDQAAEAPSQAWPSPRPPDTELVIR